MTSTSYWLPFDFWCPTNLDPLYNNEFVTPGCLDLIGGKGGATFISVGMLRTGILIDLWRKKNLKKHFFLIKFQISIVTKCSDDSVKSYASNATFPEKKNREP